jgi:hypothetical protein
MTQPSRVAFIGNSLPRHCGIASFTMARPSLSSAISGISVRAGRVSGAGLCSPFSNFHFGGAETGSTVDRDRFAEPIHLLLQRCGPDPGRKAMKSLHLLRHAKSSWKDPDLIDHDRPLSKRGRQAAKRS